MWTLIWTLNYSVKYAQCVQTSTKSAHKYRQVQRSANKNTQQCVLSTEKCLATAFLCLFFSPGSWKTLDIGKSWKTLDLGKTRKTLDLGKTRKTLDLGKLGKPRILENLGKPWILENLGNPWIWENLDRTIDIDISRQQQVGHWTQSYW